MSSVWNKIHRIKASGWTWDEFLSAIEREFPGGMEEKTLKAHYRYPHRKATHHITHIIDIIHEQRFPNPFPEPVERLMQLYNRIARNRKNTTRDQDIADLEYFLLSLSEGSELQQARLYWLLGNIAFDRIAPARNSGKREELASNQQWAIERYEQSLGMIEAYNVQATEPVGQFILYKLRQNILACYLNAVHEDKRAGDKTILAYVMESDFLQRSQQMLELEPFQWLIARNGLRFGSMLQDREQVEWFFRALVKAYDGFRDLHYEPLNHNAVADSDNFTWAIEEVLTAEGIERLCG